MMFYIRTADKVTRTSVWLENLEGGIDYVKEVVIGNKLGINEQLEKDMAAAIASFQCEWTTTLSDQDQLSRFNHFINSDLQDDNVVFTPTRDQKRPAFNDEKAPIYNIELENA
jgi:nitrite reductase (NADH) large subunit